MILFHCTMLRTEEKAIVVELEKRKLPLCIQLPRDGFKRDVPGAVVLLRLLSHSESQLYSTYCEYSNITCVNSASAIRLCTNKAALATLAESSKIPQPKFQIVFSPAELSEMPDRIGYPFVIKPVSSSWGRGVCQVRDGFCLETWVAGRESLDANHRQFPVIVQEFVEKPGYDIRVVVVGSQPIVAFRRVSSHWKTNTHLGATVEPMPLSDDIRAISLKVIEMLGKGIYGIDLFQTSDGSLLLNEVNHNPDFSRSSEIHGVNIAGAIADFMGETLCAR